MVLAVPGVECLGHRRDMRNAFSFGLRHGSCCWPGQCYRAQSFRRGRNRVQCRPRRSRSLPAKGTRSSWSSSSITARSGPTAATSWSSAQNKEMVPMRVLQLGPGDFCRAGLPNRRGGTAEYEILYGGDPPTEKPPPWTCRDGLLLETRQFKPLQLQQPRFGAQGVRLGRAHRRRLRRRRFPRLQSLHAQARAVPEPLQRLPATCRRRASTASSPPARIAASC